MKSFWIGVALAVVSIPSLAQRANPPEVRVGDQWQFVVYGVSGINSVIDAQTTLTYWYAPAANAIVKSIYLNPYLGPSTVELVEYKPQR
jgi:hypothetical protein